MDEVLDIFTRTTDGAYALDTTQCIVFWNTAAERILGYSADDVMGRSCHEIFHGEPRPGCAQCRPDCPMMGAALRQETVPTYNLLSRTKDGESILLNVSVIVPEATTRAYTAIHLFRDASRQLQYETYVEQLLCAAARLPSPQATGLRQHTNALAVYAPLTPREKAVLCLLVDGQTAREIADALSVSYATVRNHLQKILRKLNVHSQRDAVKVAVEHRLV